LPYRTLRGARWIAPPQGNPRRPLAEQILALRGVPETQWPRFLAPSLNQLASPGTMTDLDKGAARIADAIERRETIAIWGDYDVDGVTSSAVMARAISLMGGKARVHIPDRFADGYGLNVSGIEQLAKEGARLIVSVDCGITAFEPARRAREFGIDLIVTDHHLPEAALPEAVAVVNPNRHDCPFVGKELAGVGIAFYTMLAVRAQGRERGWFANREEPDLRCLLPWVATGTIADVAKLTGLNRVLVHAGLRWHRSQPDAGMRALEEVAGLKGELTPGRVGFQIGPRLNAGGRIAQGILGLNLLLSEDPAERRLLAKQLDQLNQERRAVEDEILREALPQAEIQVERGMRALVVAGPWHPGVIGIVASRLTDRFYRPSLVFALDEEQGKAKGSARSIKGLHLLDALRRLDDGRFIAMGGHAMAAGMTLAAGDLGRFHDDLDRVLGELEDELFMPRLAPDLALAPGQIDEAGRSDLLRLEPFGHGNPEPLLAIEIRRLIDPRFRDPRMMMATVELSDGRQLPAVAFNLDPHPDLIGGLDRPHWVAARLSSFRDRVQLQIQDWWFGG